jgi:uncharacterized integral membrane protein (TIGR00698 family)
MTSLISLIIGIILFFELPPHWSILIGTLIAFIFPASIFYKKNGKKISTFLLQLSIILLGAGLNFQSVLSEGKNGILVTFTSISAVFIFGFLLTKIFKISSPLSELITMGTAICGGSAISALAPILKATNLAMAISLGVVFILNAVSVFVFPPIGYYFQLTQEQFGTWAALAIHDTSSVIAASQIYGDVALKIGTTLKLTRALWIIPISIIFATIKKSENKIKLPWFIFLFLFMSLLFTFFTEIHFLIPTFSKISKLGLSITLFLIGLSLDKNQLKEIGVRPVLFGISLWLITGILSLIFVMKASH